MLLTIAVCFTAGFFGGNGLPYYVAGSTGNARNPSPFHNSPFVNVIVGCAAMALGRVLWSLANVQGHEAAAWISGFAGILVVGLIHARTWRKNPWKKP